MGRKPAASSTQGAEVRGLAEQQLRRKQGEAYPPGPEPDLQRLVHELQVHQIELEIQNEELLRAREELETSLERYAILFDFAPVGYVTLERSGMIRNVNLTGATMLGLGRKRLAGMSVHRFVSSGNRPAFAAFVESVFTGSGHTTCEAVLHRADQHPFHARIEADASASGDECLVAIIDITATKEAEMALQESGLQLERLNTTLEQCVNAAVDELRRKDRMLLNQNRQAAMGEMIGCIAHQWRQPLNTLALNIQRLGLFYDLGKFSKEFLDASITDAKQLILHMSETIDDFRNFFRNDKEMIAFELERPVNAAIALVRDSLLARQIALDVRKEGNPLIKGYPNEYAQALLNIILNAQDALMEREVQEPRILVTLSARKGRSVVTVTDNAGGIPADILDKIFEPYFTTKGPDKGTGVGLFMAKTIIETNMHGRLTARNVEGGAEFRIEV